MTFHSSYDFVLNELEKGVHTPSLNDPNPTKDGITANTFRSYYPNDDLMLMTDDQRSTIYQAYYNQSRSGLLLSPIDTIHFAFVFNAGFNPATICLQNALEVEADGIIGPNSLSAINILNSSAFNMAIIKYKLLNEQMIHYYNLAMNPKLRDNLESWIGRLVKVSKL